MLDELGVSAGTALVVLIALYFIVKWAVKNGVKEALKDWKPKRGAPGPREDAEEDAGEDG